MRDAYAIVHIPKSLPIHGMALTSTGRKIEHNKVVVDTQTYKSNGLVSIKLQKEDGGLYKDAGFSLPF